jgi:hypothetical protein
METPSVTADDAGDTFLTGEVARAPVFSPPSGRST